MESHTDEDDVVPDEDELFEVDVNLVPLQAVLTYALSDLPQQRYAYIRGIAPVASSCADDPEALPQLVQLALTIIRQREDEGWPGPHDPESQMVAVGQVGELGPAMAASRAHASIGGDGDVEGVDGALLRLLQALVELMEGSIESEDEVRQSASIAYGDLFSCCPPARPEILLEHAHRVAGTTANGQPSQPPAPSAQYVPLMLAACAGHLPYELLRGQAVQLYLQLTSPAPAVGAVGAAVAPTGGDAAAETQQAAAYYLHRMCGHLRPAHRGPFAVQALTALTAAAATSWDVRRVVADWMPDLLTVLGGGQAAPGGAGDDQWWQQEEVEVLVGAERFQQQAQGQGAAAEGDEEQQQHELRQWQRQALDILVQRLGGDVSQWVRAHAVRMAGPCIGAVPRSLVSPQLLGLYTSAALAPRPHDPEVVVACALSLGEVVAKVGASAWSDPSLQLPEALQALLAHKSASVFSATVSQLPQLAAALGPEVTEAAVVPELLAQLSRRLTDETAKELAAALAPLVAAVGSAECRVRLLALLPKLAAPPAEGQPKEAAWCGWWRSRHVLAGHLSQLALAVGPSLAADHVLPVALALCGDPVSAVRTTAARQLARMLLLPARPHLGAAAAGPQTSEQQQSQDGAQGQQLPAAAVASSSGSGAGCWDAAGASGGEVAAFRAALLQGLRSALLAPPAGGTLQSVAAFGQLAAELFVPESAPGAARSAPDSVPNSSGAADAQGGEEEVDLSQAPPSLLAQRLQQLLHAPSGSGTAAGGGSRAAAALDVARRLEERLRAEFVEAL